MFDIEHRRGERAVAHQRVQSRRLTEALTAARRVASGLGADHMTVSDDRGDLIGVFQAAYRAA